MDIPLYPTYFSETRENRPIQLFYFASKHILWVLIRPPQNFQLLQLYEKSVSCTPDREILCFTLCEKFLSHPCYLTPGVPACTCLFNTGNTTSLNVVVKRTRHDNVRNILFQNGRCSCSAFSM